MRVLLILLVLFTYFTSFARFTQKCQTGYKAVYENGRLNECVEENPQKDESLNQKEKQCKLVFETFEQKCPHQILNFSIDSNQLNTLLTKGEFAAFGTGLVASLKASIGEIQFLKKQYSKKRIECEKRAKICYNQCGKSQKCKDIFQNFSKGLDSYLNKLEKMKVRFQITLNQIKDKYVDPNVVSDHQSAFAHEPNDNSQIIVTEWLLNNSDSRVQEPENEHFAYVEAIPSIESNPRQPSNVKNYIWWIPESEEQTRENLSKFMNQRRGQKLNKQIQEEKDLEEKLEKEAKEKIEKQNKNILLERIDDLSGDSVDQCRQYIKKSTNQEKGEKLEQTWCDFLSCATTEAYNKIIREIANGSISFEKALDVLIEKHFNEKDIDSHMKDFAELLLRNSKAKEEIKKRLNVKIALHKKILQSLTSVMKDFLGLKPAREEVSQGLKSIINLHLINQLSLKLGKIDYYTIFHTYVFYPKLDDHENVFGLDTATGITSLKKIYSNYIFLSEDPTYADIKKDYSSKNPLNDAGEFMFSCLHCLSDLLDQPRLISHNKVMENSHVKYVIDLPEYKLTQRPLYLAKNFLIEALKNLSKKKPLLEDHFEVLVYKDMLKNFITKGRADTSVLKNHYFLIRDPAASAAEYSELFNALAKYGVYYYYEKLNPYIPKNYRKSSNDYFSSKNVTARWIDSIIRKWPTNNDEIKEKSHKISICKSSELVNDNIFIKKEENEKAKETKRKNFSSVLKYYCSQ